MPATDSSAPPKPVSALTALRRARGYTVAQLAEAVGCSRTAIIQIEAQTPRRYPSATSALAGFFDVTEAEIRSPIVLERKETP